MKFDIMTSGNLGGHALWNCTSNSNPVGYNLENQLEGGGKIFYPYLTWFYFSRTYLFRNLALTTNIM